MLNQILHHMKQLLLLLIIPTYLIAQKEHEFIKADKEFCRETKNSHGFDEVYSEPYSLAGKDKSYPYLTRVINIDVTTNSSDSAGFVRYKEEVKVSLDRIAKEYSEMLLKYHPDEKETLIMFLLKFSKNGFTIRSPYIPKQNKR